MNGQLRLSLACEPIERLVDVVREASGAVPGAAPADQVRYLASYLRHADAGANTILVERPYVDRHWLEEYAGYYATMLKPPPAKATRLHFLKPAWSLDDFLALVESAARGERKDAEEALRDAYLGFSVIRPLPSAPVGRTILRPYAGEPLRCFAAGHVDHKVHLAGLTVSLAGLPFQQQDQGVGACATTALWSALTKVMRNDGNRGPTPFAITAAATDHRVQGRAFPAVEGLDLDQIATAILAHGYQPHQFKPTEEAVDDFVLALKAYLRSGIPVIVRARVGGVLHAMTFVGFREEPQLGKDRDLLIRVKGKVQLRSRGVVRWYVHDDRLGAYARIGLERDPDGSIDHLELMPTDESFEQFRSSMHFSDALVPLYPKLRLTAEELVEFSMDLRPPLGLLSGAGSLPVEPQFFLGGDYVRGLQARPIGTDRAVQISTSLLLSRYVGVLSWFVGDDWICDAVYDTTDLRRDSRTRPPLIALVPRDPAWIASLENVRAARFGPSPLIA